MNRLYCGDNLPILRDIPDNTIDLIYADPPFCTGRKQTGKYYSWREAYAYTTSYEDSTDFDRQKHIEKGIGNNHTTDPEWLSRNEGTQWEFLKHICTNIHLYYFEQMIPVIEECFRVLKLTGACYYHVDYRTAYLYRLIFRKIFRDLNCFGNEIIWYYPNKVGLGQSRKFVQNHNTILFYRKVNSDQQPIHPLNLEYEVGRKKMGTVWTIPYVQGKERVGYPTQKPVKLLQRIIKASSNEGDIVLDPFAGSGTTLDAAQSLGRQWIGIDQNPAAIELIEKRLTSQYPLFMELGRDYEVIDRTPSSVKKRLDSYMETLLTNN